MSFGNCGYAFPAAMGAKVAAPDRPCVAYVGDGAWGMSLAEMLTCVREDVPAVAVVFNNEQWGAEKKNQVSAIGPTGYRSCTYSYHTQIASSGSFKWEQPCLISVVNCLGGQGRSWFHSQTILFFAELPG